MSAAVPAVASEVQRLVTAADVERVLRDEVATHTTDAAEVAPAADDVVDVQLADTLNWLLHDLNRLNVARYSLDNSWAVREGLAPELSVYSHVQAALMQVLERLAGTPDRAQQLRGHLIDCVDEGTAYVLARVRPGWAADDEAAATEQKPLSVLVRGLLDAQRTGEGYAAMVDALVAIGAMWWCGECDWHTVAVTNSCANCATARPAQPAQLAASVDA